MAPAAAATASSLFLCRLPPAPSASSAVFGCVSAATALLLLPSPLLRLLPLLLSLLLCSASSCKSVQWQRNRPAAFCFGSGFFVLVVYAARPGGTYILCTYLHTSRRRKKTTNLILAIKNKVPPTFIVLAIGRSLLSNRLLPVFHCSF